MRIGHGFDAHKFSTEGDLILGGVTIDQANKLQAHSDGDVLLHALCDAILGAAGLGDIGKYFPDTDDQWLDVDSRKLLRQVMEKIHQLDYQIANLDITVIAQIPKIAPHIDDMKRHIALDTCTEINQINVKATTTEKMGYIGRKEGIAVHAVVLLIK
ncbi:MAG: 2-C-methyl-D-erythritol 2,4-cyclodiphosphate synthase [Gammaproteobacteria bacterium]|nr:MAG: 2-C-methyl-D-erythritol 2,4-cyclodiphosphate synthase [Gammaproteobacteria bacterium]